MTLSIDIRVPRSEFEVDVNLTLDRTTALVGASGSGKSTLLRTIAGVDSGSFGVIEVDGDRWLDGFKILPPTLRSVGYLGQRDGLFPHMTAQDNVAFPMRADGVGRTQRRRAASELLDRLDLAPLGHSRPHELSGGQRRRVALARALASPRAAYLLDEPLTGLDDRTVLLTVDFIADQLADFGGIGLVAVHDKASIRGFVSRTVSLDRGRVVEDISAPAAARRVRASAAARRNTDGRQLHYREGSR